MKEEERLKLQSIALLEALVNDFTAYNIVLTGRHASLLPVFDNLILEHMVCIQDGSYEATDAGKRAVKCYLERKQDWRNMYDVYSRIDLETGDFAWEIDLEDISGASKMLAEPRWSDLRLAVAEFKGLDLHEVAFFLCLEYNKKLVPGNIERWQHGFMDANSWLGVEMYLNGMPKISDLNFEDWESKVPGEEVIKGIIEVGAQINLFTYKDLEDRVDTFSEKFDVTVPDQMAKDTPQNYLKASWVAECWRLHSWSSKVKDKPCRGYW